MPQQELLKRVVAILDGLKIPFMVTGSHVSSLQKTLDRTYIESWIVQLGLPEVWGRLLKEARPI